MPYDETGKFYTIDGIGETGEQIYFHSVTSTGRRTFYNTVYTYLGETYNISDILLKSAGKTLEENIILVATPIKSITRNIIESIYISDLISKILTRTMSTENIAILNNITKKPLKPLTESIGVNDSLTKALSRTVVESVNITCNLIKTITRNIAEVITINDYVDSFRAILKYLSETITITATMGQRSISKVLTEGIYLTSNISKVITRIIPAESVVLNIYILRATSKRFYESIVIVNSLVKSLTRNIIEPITITTTGILSRYVYLILNESIAVVDALIKTPMKTLSENIIISENRPVITLTRVIRQPINIIATWHKAFMLYLNENINITDGLNRLRPLAVTARATVAASLTKITQVFLGGDKVE